MITKCTFVFNTCSDICLSSYDNMSIFGVTIQYQEIRLRKTDTVDMGFKVCHRPLHVAKLSKATSRVDPKTCTVMLRIFG